MLRDHKAPAEGLLHQPGGRQWAQAVVVQAQQYDRTAAKALLQRVHEPLQPHGVGQFGDQVRE